MGLLSFLSGSKKTVMIKEYLDKGAIVLDVRTSGEFGSGHPKGARNIPVNQVQAKVAEIKSWNKPIVACCMSGARSGMAQGILKQHGIDAINGGPWQNVEKALS